MPSLGDLLFMPLNQLANLNVGFVNLLCAGSLPDTLDLDIPACLNTLEDWSKQIALETKRCMYLFHRSPEKYKYSEAYFRAMMMVTILQQDCGVSYNVDARKTHRFASSREGFIHGLLTGDKTGTCANTPVLIAAIGRRIGYPIYMVATKGHLFNRWHDAKTGERFNIEASGKGFSSLTDAYYYTWPYRIKDFDVKHGIYLKNLDPAEQLGCFMATRGHCLNDKDHLLDAIVAYTHAHRLCPVDPTNLAYLLAALNKELQLRNEGKLPITYLQAETWDEKLRNFQFILKTDYQERIAGFHEHDQPMSLVART